MLRETVRKTVVLGLMLVVVGLPVTAIEITPYFDVGATYFTQTQDVTEATVAAIGARIGGGLEWKGLGLGVEAGYTQQGTDLDYEYGWLLPIIGRLSYTLPLDTITFRPALFAGTRFSNMTQTATAFDEAVETSKQETVLGGAADLILNMPGDHLSLYAGASASVLVGDGDMNFLPEIRAGLIIKPVNNRASRSELQLRGQVEELSAERERLQAQIADGNRAPVQQQYTAANAGSLQNAASPVPPAPPRGYAPAPYTGPNFTPGNSTTTTGAPPAIIRNGLFVSHPGAVASVVSGPQDLASAASVQSNTYRAGYATNTQPAARPVVAAAPPSLLAGDGMLATTKSLPPGSPRQEPPIRVIGESSSAVAGLGRNPGSYANTGYSGTGTGTSGRAGAAANTPSGTPPQTGTAQLAGLSGATPSGTIFPGAIRTVYFVADSPYLLNPSQKVLNQIGEQLKANQGMHVTLRGYSAPAGTSEDGRKSLSKDRASAVAQVLQRSFGLASDQLTVEWFGAEKRPASSQDWDIASFRAVEMVFS
jgi:outer membrane protein OmpA-like peptidoglycan-associated protein